MSVQSLKSRIEDELDRSDLSLQVDQAIETAIKYYQLDRFFFAESRVTFFTRVDAAYYSFPEAAAIDMIEITDHQGSRTSLRQIQWSELREALGPAQPHRYVPHVWASYGACFGVYPIPDAIYQMTIHFSRAMPVDDENPYIVDAEDLIRYRAKREIYTHVTKDADMAGMMAQAESDLLEKIHAHSARRKATNNIRPRRF